MSSSAHLSFDAYNEIMFELVMWGSLYSLQRGVNQFQTWLV